MSLSEYSLRPWSCILWINIRIRPLHDLTHRRPDMQSPPMSRVPQLRAQRLSLTFFATDNTCPQTGWLLSSHRLWQPLLTSGSPPQQNIKNLTLTLLKAQGHNSPLHAPLDLIGPFNPLLKHATLCLLAESEGSSVQYTQLSICRQADTGHTMILLQSSYGLSVALITYSSQHWTIEVMARTWEILEEAYPELAAQQLLKLSSAESRLPIALSFAEHVDPKSGSDLYQEEDKGSYPPPHPLGLLVNLSPSTGCQRNEY